MSIVEQRIRSKDFSYLQPYFYNNPYALRCELGMGDTGEAYMANAKIRALEIYHILFPEGADAIFFNRWIYDYCDSGDADCSRYGEDAETIMEARVENTTKSLRFLLAYQFRYRHVTVRNLPTYNDPGDEDYDTERRNRVICFSDGIGFDYQKIIEDEIEGVNGSGVSFVSFENECIYSIYDDRGCDVVFMTHEKLKEFYHRLQPYFLEYDLEEMAKRYDG